MTIDLDKYSVNKSFIQDWYLTRSKDDPRRAISILAASTGVPCIVVAFYIGEVCDWRPEVLQSIKTLTEFYGYSKIENKPEGSPV